MPVTLNGLNSTPRSDTLNSVASAEVKFIPSTGTFGAGVVNTTVSGYFMPGVQYKIRKVAFSLMALDSVAGTDLFNLVVGTGTYTSAASSAASNDNSFDPQTTTQVGVNLQGVANPILGGLGYPTDVAVAGQTVFGADYALTVANVPNLATGTGGYAVAIPTNYDAIYPANIPLTLRVTTTASTGSISNMAMWIVYVPIRIRPAPPGPEAVAPLPGVDY